MPSKKSGIPTSVFRLAVFAALIGGFSPAIRAYAETQHPSAQHMEQRVEERIHTLHEKLGIMKEQEEMWHNVAQTMRDNEAAMAGLIEARHKKAKEMTAIEDLQSYETITRAHADGIRNLIPPFQTLYTNLSDDQKKAADEAFGRFEGHRGDKSSKKEE